MKYYYVFYKCKCFGWKPSGQSTGVSEIECQTIINIHPLQFQINCNEKYGKEHETSGGHTAREEYTVVNWIELTKDEYDEYHGQI